MTMLLIATLILIALPVSVVGVTAVFGPIVLSALFAVAWFQIALLGIFAGIALIWTGADKAAALLGIERDHALMAAWIGAFVIVGVATFLA